MFWYFFKREILTKYKGNITGLSWIFIQPIILLSIYSFVFEKIFNARYTDVANVGFTAYLAIAFWPWIAFSESILKSITVIDEKKDLVGKIALNFNIPVIATITATFILNIIGYILVLFVLFLYDKNLIYNNIPLLIIPVSLLYVFALSLGLILSSLQVYIKDTYNFISTIVMIWFYLTPIIYSKSIVPIEYQEYITLNPIYYPIELIHNLLLNDSVIPWSNVFIVSIIYIVLLIVSFKFFKKLSRNFEDFI